MDFPDDQGEAFNRYKSKTAFMIDELERAARAASFDDAAWHIGNFLAGLRDRGPYQLRDAELEQIEGVFAVVRSHAESWPAHAYQREVAQGLEAAWAIVWEWSGGAICDDPTGPTKLDVTQQLQVFRNSCQNVVFMQDLTARAHKRRDGNVRSLMAARRARGLA